MAPESKGPMTRDKSAAKHIGRYVMLYHINELIYASFHFLIFSFKEPINGVWFVLRRESLLVPLEQCLRNSFF